MLALSFHTQNCDYSHSSTSASAVITLTTTRWRAPAVITTSTTVLGLLPLGLGFGEGAEIQQPLALTLMGGLVSATLLTLWVVPTVYRTLGALERR